MNKKATISYISGWMKAYCEKAGMNGFVIGVSGGIDSALTSTLCALTGKQVIVVNMPILQNKDQYNLADAHIRWMKKNYKNVRSYDVDLTGTFQRLKKDLPAEVQDARSMANTRSRLRMVTLYAIGAHFKLLVAGTGNKVEDFGVGFYTKYGDGGVDLSPIADLMKSEVYALADELGVIEGILNAAPVDGLWADNRTDEEQIGATYAELEWAMNKWSEKPKAKSKKLTTRQKQVLEIFRKFNRMNRHKMIPIPICKVPGKFRK